MRFIVTLSLMGALAGCRGDRACVPGTQISCACPGGAQGTQVCEPRGTGFNPCHCAAATGTGKSIAVVEAKVAKVAPAPVEPPKPKTIRDIDFKNRSYKGLCYDEKETIKVRKGRGKIGNPGPDGDGADLTIQKISYADLTGDGAEEALVQTDCYTGGNRPTISYLVYSIRDDKVVELWRTTGSTCGDEDGALSGVSMEDGKLLVELTKGTCCACAERVETSTYKWNGAKFIRDGKVKTRKAQ